MSRPKRQIYYDPQIGLYRIYLKEAILSAGHHIEHKGIAKDVKGATQRLAGFKLIEEHHQIEHEHASMGFVLMDASGVRQKILGSNLPVRDRNKIVSALARYVEYCRGWSACYNWLDGPLARESFAIHLRRSKRYSNHYVNDILKWNNRAITFLRENGLAPNRFGRFSYTTAKAETSRSPQHIVEGEARAIVVFIEKAIVHGSYGDRVIAIAVKLHICNPAFCLPQVERVRVRNLVGPLIQPDHDHRRVANPLTINADCVADHIGLLKEGKTEDGFLFSTEPNGRIPIRYYTVFDRFRRLSTAVCRRRIQLFDMQHYLGSTPQ